MPLPPGGCRLPCRARLGGVACTKRAVRGMPVGVARGTGHVCCFLPGPHGHACGAGGAGLGLHLEERGPAGAMAAVGGAPLGACPDSQPGSGPGAGVPAGGSGSEDGRVLWALGRGRTWGSLSVPHACQASADPLRVGGVSGAGAGETWKLNPALLQAWKKTQSPTLLTLRGKTGRRKSRLAGLWLLPWRGWGQGGGLWAGGGAVLRGSCSRALYCPQG